MKPILPLPIERLQQLNIPHKVCTACGAPFAGYVPGDLFPTLCHDCTELEYEELNHAIDSSDAYALD